MKAITPAKKEVAPLSKAEMISIFGNLEKSLQDVKNPMEEAYSKISGYLWDRKTLDKMSRLNGDQIAQIVKSKVIIRFYQKFWTQRKCNFVFQKIKEPPYYKAVPDYKDVLNLDRFNQEFEEFLNDILSLLISHMGLGRKEAIEIMGGARETMTLQRKIVDAIGNTVT